jgi:hypothetical protein
MAGQTLTITRTIVGINPIGGNIWQIEFNPAQTVLTTNSSTSPVIYYSSSALPVILNPFLNNIGNFNNSDYNAIINNTTINRLSEYYKQIDYATAQTVPVNFEAIISGTAYPAAVQDSNYTSYQYSGIRYWGSKNTTDNFNTSSISESLYTQNYQNANIGATTLGYASVDKLDATILEFNWGSGTYPEIIEGGALSLNQSLLVGADRNAVGIFATTETGFLEAVSLTFPINSNPIFNQYTTNAITTAGAKVSGYGFSVPSVSNYMLFTNQATFSGLGFTGTIGTTRDSITFSNSASVVTTNTAGFYTTGSSINSEDMCTQISNSIAGGDEWYVSLYRNFPSTVQGTLIPFNSGSNANYSLQNEEGYINPLTSRGVYKIISAGALIVNIDPSIKFPAQATIGGTNAGNLGMLLWKAIPGAFMLFNDATLSGLGKGGLVTSTPSPVIQKYFTYITQEYGTNPKNQ